MFILRAVAIAAAAVAPALAAAAIPGDFNNDGVISTADLSYFADCLHGPGAAGCPSASLDGDGDTDLHDFAIWMRTIGTSDCRVTATSSSAEATPLYDAFNAIDGLRSTRWSSSFADNQWLQLDLHHPRTLTGLTIHWEAAYARVYSVQVSNDAAGWSTLYSTITSDGGDDVINLPPFTARYVRVFCSQRATAYGNSIWEIDLHSADACFRDPRDIELRIDELLAAMTLAEKVSLLYGETAMSLRAIPRLGIPALQLADGPLGIRWGQSTAFPAPIAQAASWDPSLVQRFGAAMAAEWRNKGRQVWLGPAMNIIRVPQNGRNFEYYSEDPFLAARMAVAAVQGAQAGGIVACVKHYACNNQEQDRTTVNVGVDERTLHEIYLPAFEAAVREGGALSIMAAYNRVNGAYCTANSVLLDDILKDDWDFQGFAVSDWGAVHETVGAANAGLDLEMDGESPTGLWWGAGKLLAAVQNGSVSQAAIDDKVCRILRAILFTGVMDEPWDSPDRQMTEHNALAREIAREGIVLLKNDAARLPLDRTAAQTIAVLGPAYAQAGLGGGGSSVVTPYYSVTPLQGLQSAAGPNVTFVAKPGVLSDTSYSAAPSSYLRPPSGGGNGLLGEYYDGMTLSGPIRLSRTDAQVNFNWGGGTPTAAVGNDTFSIRWTGKLVVPTSGMWQIGMATDDGCRVYLNGQLQVNDWHDHGLQLNAANVALTANVEYPLVLEYYENGGDASAIFVCRQNQALGEAVAAAQSAAAALVFVGLTPAKESEGFDRPTIDLTADEVSLIRSVAAVNPNTMVIVVAGSQVGLDAWIDEVPVLLQAWYGGQEAGNAIADVIFGLESPSAKLPMTFVRRWEDHPAYGLYPGGNYADGLGVGYRYFDEPGSAAPAFPFGFGLSYTTFVYSNLQLDASHFASDGTVQVTFTLQNTGNRSGAEVAQVYVRDVAASVPRPIKELRGFAKVTLAAQQSQQVTLTLDRRAFAYYDATAHDWIVEPGDFEILVGASSRDIRLSESVSLPGM